MAEQGDTAMLAAIIAAKSAGASWASVGSTMGCDGKTAKKRAKALARNANRRLAMQPRDDGGSE